MARFLFVEDNEDMRNPGTKMLRLVLSPDEVVVAENYDEAIKAFEIFGGILSDLNYRGPNGEGDLGGLDLLAYVQQHAPQTPFFLYTGRSREVVLAMLQNAGLSLPEDHIFYKPVHFAEIAKIMKERSYQAIRPDIKKPPDEGTPRNTLE